MGSVVRQRDQSIHVLKRRRLGHRMESFQQGSRILRRPSASKSFEAPLSRLGQYSPTTSPPARVPSRCQTLTSTLLLMNWTCPSQNSEWTPPTCLLRDAMLCERRLHQ